MTTLASIVEQMFAVPTVIFVVGGAIAIVAIVFGTVAGAVSTVSKSRDRERSRREIAAYVAEGSIDPDKAAELLRAGPPPDAEA
jgi:hypothetical protein